MEIGNSKKVDWKEIYGQVYAGEMTEASNFSMKMLAISDTFSPVTVNQIEEKELEELFALIGAIYALEEPPKAGKGKLPYFLHYRKIVEKILVLACEKFPELVEVLPKQMQEKLVNLKIDLPDEQSLYDESYLYILNKAQSPYIFPGQSFAQLIDEQCKNLALATKIKGINAEYSLYFLKK